MMCCQTCDDLFFSAKLLDTVTYCISFLENVRWWHYAQQRVLIRLVWFRPIYRKYWKCWKCTEGLCNAEQARKCYPVALSAPGPSKSGLP